MYTCTVVAEAFSSAIDQAARTPAGRGSSESVRAVADDAVERHEDDLADEPGDDARAFFGFVAGFFGGGAPLGVAAPAPASCAAEMSAVLASAGGGTPAPTGCSKSREAQEVCLDWTAELMDAPPPPPPAAATSSAPLNSFIQLGQEPLAPNPTCDTCLTSVGYPISISCSLCTVNI